MTRGPWLLSKFAGSWLFEEVSPGRTRVRFRYHLRARPGWLTPVLGWVFAREMRQRLSALKEAAEGTGR
jgi:hypothetical protein